MKDHVAFTVFFGVGRKEVFFESKEKWIQTLCEAGAGTEELLATLEVKGSVGSVVS